MKIGEYKQMMNYLTRPKNNSSIDQRRVTSNKNPDTKVATKKPNNAFDNIIKTSAIYDDNKEAEQHLRKELIDKMGRGEPLDSDQVRFLMETKPKQPEATPQQMAELKKKIDKYKYVHFPKEKPFKQPKKKSAVLSIPSTPIVRDPIPEPKPKPKEPEEPLEVMIARRADERLQREQEKYDQDYGTTGIVKLLRPL